MKQLSIFICAIAFLTSASSVSAVSGYGGSLNASTASAPVPVTLTDINNVAITSLPLTGTTTVRYSVNGTVPTSAAPIVEFTMANSSLIDPATFTGVTMGVGSLSGRSMAFAHGLTSAPGLVGASFTLYVPRLSGDTQLMICPGASSLAQVSNGCGNASVFNTSGALILGTAPGVSVSLVFINSVEYWKIVGLTGTGAQSQPASVTSGGGGGGGGGIFSGIGSSLLGLIAFGGTNQSVSNPVNTGLILGTSTFATSSAISGFKFNYNMRMGSRLSPDVVNLQARLGVIQTGFFGPLTYAAVVRYQRANGIPATGFVGPLTRAALNR